MKTAAAVLALAFGITGCGSDDEAPAADSPATQTSAVVTPTPSPTPTPTEPPAPVTPTFGNAITTELGKVTVYEVDFPVQDSRAEGIATSGTDFAVADIQVCSNGTEDAAGYQYSADQFLLVDKKNRTYSFWNVQIGARAPNLSDALFSKIGKGQCRRGWLTFELPPRTKIKAVAFASYGGEPVLWVPK